MNAFPALVRERMVVRFNRSLQNFEVHHGELVSGAARLAAITTAATYLTLPRKLQRGSRLLGGRG